MTIEELIISRMYLEDMDKSSHSCNEYLLLKDMIETNLKKEIILSACAKREKLGYETLSDSDIISILEECDRLSVSMTKEEVKSIFEENAPLKYFVVQAYKNKVDENYRSHLLPSYLTSYNKTLGGNGFGLQSGLPDALKFKSKKDAVKWKEFAQERFLDRNWEIVEIDERLLGKLEVKYVI